jgi:hypothetical protein
MSGWRPDSGRLTVREPGSLGREAGTRASPPADIAHAIAKVIRFLAK